MHASTTLHTDTTATLVIIGAGMAGGEVALQARQQGWQGRIMLVGAEPDLPYHRPMLSKTYLTGKSDADTLLMRAASAYEKANIDVRLACTVLSLDRAKQQVVFADGRQQSYDMLVFCTGGSARSWTCPGMIAQPKNVYTLRSRADAEALRARLNPESRLAVIGGGYIGLEVAASARSLGVQVTLLEAQERLLARSASVPLAAFYADLHRSHGVDIRLSAQIAQVHCDAQGDIQSLCLSSGQTLPVDVVLAGVGMQANISVAHAAGLHVDGGIVVDVNGRTSDPAIFAAGDCAIHTSARYGRQVRFESVPNALEQARAAASAMCGKPREQHGVPWFWSDQYDVKLQMAGLATDYDAVVSRGSLEVCSFITFYLKGRRVVAAEAVNRPADFMMARKWMDSAVQVAPVQLGDVAIALRDVTVST